MLGGNWHNWGNMPEGCIPCDRPCPWRLHQISFGLHQSFSFQICGTQYTAGVYVLSLARALQHAAL